MNVLKALYTAISGVISKMPIEKPTNNKDLWFEYTHFPYVSPKVANLGFPKKSQDEEDTSVITWKVSSISVQDGGEYYVILNVDPVGTEYTIKSSDSNVATAELAEDTGDDNITYSIHGNSPGTCKIYAKVNGKIKDELSVTVVAIDSIIK